MTLVFLKWGMQVKHKLTVIFDAIKAHFEQNFNQVIWLMVDETYYP